MESNLPFYEMHFARDFRDNFSWISEYPNTSPKESN